MCNDAEYNDPGYVDPGREQFAFFKGLDRDQPIYMLNMLRFNDSATYPEDHPRAGESLTGAEAYDLYGVESGPIFQRVGGSIVWRGDFQATVTGPEAERWDRIFIAHYPSTHAFLEMVTDPDYRVAVINRQAAVLTSRLIRLSQQAVGDTF